MSSIIAAARAATAGTAGAKADAVVNLGSSGTTVRCNDTVWERDPRFYTREADRMTRRYPFFGYLNGVHMCAFWPHQPQDRKLDLPGSPRLLMVHSELDPQTAYEGALRTHRDTARVTRFIGIDDEGQHGQFILGPSSCVDQIGDRFVFTGELPGRDDVCGTAPLPEDGSVFPVDGPIDGNSVPIPRNNAASVTPLNPFLQQLLDQLAEHSLS